jgi:hypothetical protein
MFIPGELKVVSAHAMKTYGGSRNMAVLILKLTYYINVSGQLHTLAALSTGKEPSNTH